MKSFGYLAILGACLCGQFLASAQPASDQAAKSVESNVFVFDGGTFHGLDQGETRTTEANLARTHAA